MANWFAGLCDMKETFEKRVARGDSEFEFKLLYDVSFHVKNVLARIRPVCDVHAVLDFWWIDFFIFTSHK